MAQFIENNRWPHFAKTVIVVKISIFSELAFTVETNRRTRLLFPANYGQIRKSMRFGRFYRSAGPGPNGDCKDCACCRADSLRWRQVAGTPCQDHEL